MPDEPRRQMRLSDIAPNFRCTEGRDGTTYVEIPHAYARYVQPGLPDDMLGAARRTIDALCRKSAGSRKAAVYDESVDDGRSLTPGWLVPLAEWEQAMRLPLSGWYVNEDAG